jgi:hypothetical protein
MSVKLDSTLRDKGIRFRLFPQTPVLAAFREPEIVWVSSPPGGIGPGPADHRMYVVDAIDKTEPYEIAPRLPPYRGAANPPVAADESGHFDHLDRNSRAFRAAHVYGALRRVLDIWEDYCDAPIPWHFREHFERLEIIPMIDWDNAQSGYGFIETGWGQGSSGKQPYCLNFDVIAHELGHSIIFSQVGIPNEFTATNAYMGFHESAGDLVAMISVLHFTTFADHLLGTTGGNLYGLNELNRIGELSETEEIRLASNALKMNDVVSGERDLSQHELHRLGQPLTGALFDILVEVFQEMLVQRGFITPELDNLSRRSVRMNVFSETVQTQFDAAYRVNPDGFRAVLFEARDYLGERLARTWQRLSPHNLSFPAVAARFMTVDRSLSGSRYQNIIRDSFLWRRIGYGFRKTP